MPGPELLPDRIPLPVPNTPHHLDSLAAEVQRTYFGGVAPLRVRWGQQIARKRRRSIRLGSYNHITAEIRIHPLLNASNIPTYVIQSIIHHEYLHHVLGAAHNRRFHAHEKKFRYFRESQEWIRHNIHILLGRKRSEMRRPRERVLPIDPSQLSPVRLGGQMALF